MRLSIYLSAALAFIGIAQISSAQDNINISLTCEGMSEKGYSHIYFKYDGQSAQIKVPATIFVVKNQDWITVKNLEVTDEVIRGSVPIVSLSTPKFVIDRRTGGINFYSKLVPLTSMGTEFSYTGICKRFNMDENKF